MLIPIEPALHFLNELRVARAAAMEDAENAAALLTAFERLGYQLLKPERPLNLGRYGAELIALANEGAVGGALKNDSSEPDAEALFASIREARNDHMHVGVSARRLVDHAVRFALLLEAGLMVAMTKVNHFMVPSPIAAEPWQTVAHVRQTMLRYQFSFLPYLHAGAWHLISDRAVVSYVRGGDERAALARVIRDVTPQGLKLQPAQLVGPTADVKSLLNEDLTIPRLVVDAENQLRGILTAFDLL